MVFEEVYEKIKRKFPEKNVVFIGIYGMPGAGKSGFSKRFAHFLENKDVSPIVWSCDKYTKTSREDRKKVMEKVRSMKSSGKEFSDWPEKAYVYDVELMIEHLKKIKNKENFSSSGLCNPTTKNLDMGAGVFFNEDEIKIKQGDDIKVYKNKNVWFLIDWALLGLESIRSNLDILIYLDASYQVRFERARERGLSLSNPVKVEEFLFKDVDEYQKKQFNINQKYGDIVVDNNDFENRKILRCN